MKRILNLLRALRNKGVFETVKLIKKYILYNLKEKWRFVYFELDLNKEIFTLPPIDGSISIRRSVREDIPRIQSELYPVFTDKQEYDKRHIVQMGNNGIECFIAEKDYKIVHYFMVFVNALKSPLIDTPFDKRKILQGDAYLGNAFTNPNCRGTWIVPHVLLEVIDFLKKTGEVKRILLLVHEGTPGAVVFFKRLGFNIIDNSVSDNWLFLLLKKLRVIT
ncbi:hypothetical protein KJ966_04340 [bacterium]|nr:hypothetical protein [bacterium]